MSFAEIRGQDRAINILKRAISNSHVAHSYLFHGPDGVGKRKTAINFAMALNCAQDNEDACGICTSCRKISSGIHPDITVLGGEDGEIKIGSVRDLINGMAYKPIEARKRVVVADGAEKLNLSSSNAFLKTLEEPPADTVIILISSNPDMLLQTILSRCQKVPFAQIPPHIITAILMEKAGIEKEEAEFAANMASGSPGKAMSLSSGDFRHARLEIIKSLFMTGEAGREAVFSLSEKFSKDEASFYNVLFWVLTCLRDIMIMKAQGETGLIINKDVENTLSELKDRISTERLLNTIGLLKSAYRGQDRNMNRQLALDVLCNNIADGMLSGAAGSK